MWKDNSWSGTTVRIPCKQSTMWGTSNERNACFFVSSSPLLQITIVRPYNRHHLRVQILKGQTELSPDGLQPAAARCGISRQWKDIIQYTLNMYINITLMSRQAYYCVSVILNNDYNHWHIFINKSQWAMFQFPSKDAFRMHVRQFLDFLQENILR